MNLVFGGWTDHASIIQYFKGKVIDVCDIDPYNCIPDFIDCDKLVKMAEEREERIKKSTVTEQGEKPKRLCAWKHILHTTYSDADVKAAINGFDESAINSIQNNPTVISAVAA